MKKFIFISLLILSGCIYPSLDTLQVNLNKPFGDSGVVQDELSLKICDSLNGVNQQDCRELYTQCKGFSEYTKVTKLKTTGELFQLIGKVQNDFGWTKESCKEFTNIVEHELTVLGFEENKQLTDNVRTMLVKFFDSISEGCKVASKLKK